MAEAKMKMTIDVQGVPVIKRVLRELGNRIKALEKRISFLERRTAKLKGK